MLSPASPLDNHTNDIDLEAQRNMEGLEAVNSTSLQNRYADIQPKATSFRDPNLVITTKFIFFPKLPTELRLNIWKLVIPGPRLFHIDPTQSGTWGLGGSSVAPDLFLVCQEARSVIRERYNAYQGNNVRSPVMYCDFDTDYLVLAPSNPTIWSFDWWSFFQEELNNGVT
jgi:hypothetical protein